MHVEVRMFFQLPLHTTHEWQGRTVYAVISERMGLCIHKFRCPHARIDILDQALQFPSLSLFFRELAICISTRFNGEQRYKKIHLGNWNGTTTNMSDVVFVMYLERDEPLAGTRMTKVTERKAKVDWAQFSGYCRAPSVGTEDHAGARYSEHP